MTTFLSPVKPRSEGKFTSPLKFSSPVKSQELASTPAKELEALPGPSVKHLYRVIQKSTGAVGGYGHNGPIYGEITMGTFQKVVNAMVKHTGFDAGSSFVDIGAGLGKPSLHVALNPGVQLSCGIEVEELRWQLSMHNLRFVMSQVPEMRQNVVYFAHADATEMDLHAFTHVYMFDVGFPPGVLVALADAFNKSKSAQALVSFQRPDKLKKSGFSIKLVAQVLTRMNGSTEGHTAYIFTKDLTSGRQERMSTYFTPTKTSIETPIKTRAKVGKSVVDLVTKDKSTEVVVLKSNPEKKKSSASLDQLRKMDYGQYVSETGLIGAPGGRSQRAVAAVRKNYKY